MEFLRLIGIKLDIFEHHQLFFTWKDAIMYRFIWLMMLFRKQGRIMGSFKKEIKSPMKRSINICRKRWKWRKLNLFLTLFCLKWRVLLLRLSKRHIPHWIQIENNIISNFLAWTSWLTQIFSLGSSKSILTPASKLPVLSSTTLFLSYSSKPWELFLTQYFLLQVNGLQAKRTGFRITYWKGTNMS